MYGLTFLFTVTCVCDPATQFTCDNAFCIDLDGAMILLIAGTDLMNEDAF